MKRRQDAAAIQYTLRNVPPGLDRALRQRAKQLSRSLNEVAIEAMTRGAGVAHAPVEQDDIDFLFGSWVEDPDVDQALTDQRKVDPDLWS
jgi:predicted nucleotidyltransferase